jgi:hypothetical protein
MSTVRFRDAATPGLEAGVWILQLLAESLQDLFNHHLRQISGDCGKRGLGLADLPRILGGFAAQRLPSVGDDPDHLAQDRQKALGVIWRDFLGENRILKLGTKTRGLLELAARQTQARLAKGTFRFDWLEQAHTRARKFINEFLATGHLADLGEAPPKEVVVFADLTGRQFCAKTQGGRQAIEWAHQNVPHALLQMLVAERVLAHEYLSHLVPRNQALGLTVTEQWLVALLDDLYRDKDSDKHNEERGEQYWQAVTFRALRQDLELHVARMEHDQNPMLEPVRSLGIAGVEAAASVLYGSASERYWHFTTRLLAVPPEEDVEEILSDLLGYFAVAGPSAVEAALTRKYNTIRELHRSLGLGKS